MLCIILNTNIMHNTKADFERIIMCDNTIGISASKLILIQYPNS